MPDPEASRWISTFLDARTAELGAARNTQLAYGRDLSDFADWLGRHGTGFAEAGRAAVEDYLVHCDVQGLSKATRARRLSSIRQLFRFAFEEGWRKDNPALRLTGPGRAQSLPKTLTEAEVTRLMEAARTRGRNPGTGCGTRRCLSFSMPRACGSASWSACRYLPCGAIPG